MNAAMDTSHMSITKTKPHFTSKNALGYDVEA